MAGNVTFYEPLERLGNGSFLEGIEAKFREVSQAVEDVGKAGSVTVTLKVKPNGEKRVTIEGDFKGTVPTRATGAETYFVDQDGAVQRDNPDQPNLPLHSVRSEPTQLREVKNA